MSQGNVTFEVEFNDDGFTRFPNAVADLVYNSDKRTFGPKAFALWVLIVRYASSGKWTINRTHLQRATNMGEKALKGAMDQLLALGLLGRYQDRADNGDFGRVHYIVRSTPTAHRGNVDPPTKSAHRGFADAPNRAHNKKEGKQDRTDSRSSARAHTHEGSLRDEGVGTDEGGEENVPVDTETPEVDWSTCAGSRTTFEQVPKGGRFTVWLEAVNGWREFERTGRFSARWVVNDSLGKEKPFSAGAEVGLLGGPEVPSGPLPEPEDHDTREAWLIALFAHLGLGSLSIGEAQLLIRETLTIEEEHRDTFLRERIGFHSAQGRPKGAAYRYTLRDAATWKPPTERTYSKPEAGELPPHMRAPASTPKREPAPEPEAVELDPEEERLIDAAMSGDKAATAALAEYYRRRAGGGDDE